MPSESSNLVDKVRTLTQTLFANGYLLVSGRRTNHGLLADFETVDRFGVHLRYAVFLAEPTADESAVQQMKKIAAESAARLVVIAEQELATEDTVLKFDEFVGRLGGGIRSLLPLNPEFPSRLQSLGHNSLPVGLIGEPSDLFEIYTSAALQFAIGRRAMAYGSNRRFESVPDGLAITEDSYILFDAKAYSDGFDVDAASIRQFSGYVEQFSRRYGTSYGRPHAFLCITGTFLNRKDSLERKSRELFASCQVPLCCIEAATLSALCGHFSSHPGVRQSTDWVRVFAEPVLELAFVQSFAKRVESDSLAQA